jgi:hypothetical protein
MNAYPTAHSAATYTLYGLGYLIAAILLWWITSLVMAWRHGGDVQEWGELPDEDIGTFLNRMEDR